jgi:hypothetical protein
VAFVKRLDSIFPGMGQPLRNDAVFLQSGLAVTTAGGPLQAFPIPATGVLSPTTSAGKLRIKIYNPTNAPSLTQVQVKASDGTNSVFIGQSEFNPAAGIALTATLWYEQMFEYILDVASSGAGGGASGQLSGVVGGATTFSVLVTITGAGGTASMDVELAPLV